MKVHQYSEMMKYLTRPKESEYEQVAMAGPFIKGGKKVIDKLIKKGKVKKGEAPKTNLKKVRTKVQKDREALLELAKNEQIPVEQIDKLLSGEIAQVKRTAGRGVIKLDKDGNPYVTETFTAKIDPNTLSTEDLIEFRKTNRAGKGQFTNAEAIIARLENTIKEIDPNDETYEYVTTTFPNFIKELKAKPELANNENVWNNLMSDLPADQRFVKYDDGTVDFQVKRPSHTFKLREDLDTDRKGPIAPDDDPNMFDDIFNKMYPDYSEGGKYELPLPGEQPLTKKKRTLNAEGGVIGGGMIEGDDLGSRTGFRKPRILPKEDLIRLLEDGKTKTEIAKLYKTSRNTIDKNIDILISEGKLDANYGRNKISPTDKNQQKRIKLTNLINEANANFKNASFQDLAEKAGYAKDSDRGTLKNFPKLNTSEENVTKYFDSLMTDLNKPASEFKNILKKVREHVGVTQETAKKALKNHENYIINERAIKYLTLPMAQKTVLNPNITFLDIAERFETEGSMRKISSSKKMSGGYGSAEQKIMEFADRHVKQGGNQIEFLTPSNVPDSEKKFKYKGKTYDLETLRLKGPKDPNFKEFYEKFYLSKNIGNKKYKHPLTGKQVPLKEIMAEAYTKATGANILPENVFGIDHSKSVAEKPFTNLRVQDYRTNLLGGTVSKFEELQKLGVLKKEDYTPEKVKFYKKQSGYDFIGNDPDLFEKNQLNLANDIFTKGRKLRQPLEIVKERASSKLTDIPKTKRSFFNPNKMQYQFNMGFGFLDDITTQIMDDVARGAVKYGPDVLRGVGKFGLSEAFFGLPGAPFDVAEGRSRDEVLLNIATLGAGVPIKDELERNKYLESFSSGLSKDYQMAKTKQAIASGQARGYEQMNPEFSVLTDREQLALDKADEWTTTVLQPRLQEGIKSFQQYQKKFEESESDFGLGLYALGGRVGMKVGGDPKDKKKTTPALDKPTIQIDPNAPTDPAKRNTLKGAGILGAGVVAGKLGLLKFAPEIKKTVTGVTSQFDQVPNIINELYFTIKNFGKQIDYPKPGSDTVKYEFGPYKMEEGPGGYNITKTTDGYTYQEEYFEVQIDPEQGVINYDELTVRPDLDGKLKDVDYGVELETYREIGEDIAKIRGDDSLIKVADEDIIKEIEKQEAYKKSLQKKGKGEND